MKARWGVGRMSYTVVPGLYALGKPDSGSSVLVTANYKLSFDHLRRAATGIDAWILVLDTDGINVWCAAGKGTFGTEELVHRIEETQLSRIVDHRKLIVPQLGAPGIAAHKVSKLAKFRVVWGPVLVHDLAAFLKAGSKATPEMRRKRFPLRERLALIPVELVATLKPLALIVPTIFLLTGLGTEGGGYIDRILRHGPITIVAILAGVMAGAVLTPLLLPWLPGRAFSAKGALVGIPVVAAALLLWGGKPQATGSWLEFSAWILVGGSLSAFLAMNFTGASTYTSLSGVKREMRVAVPTQIVGVALGLCLAIVGRLIG
ncbi:MAG: acetyl-CoA synthase subunit gamma [bacterium]|nr:acetyl-CoA synthase subunit gamma [bacterium]